MSGQMTYGLLASPQFARANIYLNLEILINVRQMRSGPMPRPTPGHGGRRTVNAWAPLEGRSANAGVQFRP